VKPSPHFHPGQVIAHWLIVERAPNYRWFSVCRCGRKKAISWRLRNHVDRCDGCGAHADGLRVFEVLARDFEGRKAA
jgi:hypothetical protein